jgi:hypothetical protein
LSSISVIANSALLNRVKVEVPSNQV